MADNNFDFTSGGFTGPARPSNYTFDFGGTAPYYSFVALPVPTEPPSPPVFNFDFTQEGYSPTNYNFLFGWYNYYLLKGISNNFTAIWADPRASINSGKMYVSSPEAFSIVNLTSKTIYDYYTTTHSGIRNEALQSNDVTDLYIQGA
jgi:hypothetical protein